MRFAWTLLFVPLIANPQDVKVGESEGRQAARELLLAIYRAENVRKACETNPIALVTVSIDGRDFTVNCRTRNAYMELLGEK